ncbi:MAG TPA: electron transfer flavoprotein subunit alpha, partial [Idiomarina sp.]|nr:electron transfer flavoprotein subunit alpha [Idiomarina sp.]
MSILLVAEHDNNAVDPSTLKTLAAAQKLGGDIHVLVAGKGCSTVADDVAKADGVSKVFLADNGVYEHQLAENIGALVAELGKDYSHVLAPATTT